MDALNLLKVKRIYRNKLAFNDDNDDDSAMELESDSDDKQATLLVTLAFHEHHRLYYSRVPYRTSKLRRHDYILDVLNGNDVRCLNQF